jgi:hypothetical protein
MSTAIARHEKRIHERLEEPPNVFYLLTTLFEALERVIQEADILSTLRHPNILKCHGVYDEPKTDG